MREDLDRHVPSMLEASEKMGKRLVSRAGNEPTARRCAESSVPQVFNPRLVKLWKQGRFPFDKLVRHYALSDINHGFEDSESGSVIKPIVSFAD